MSRSDAAKRLGIAEGTLSSRLAKARKLLAAALGRREFAFAVAASAPPTLCAATLRAATDTAPAAVSALADGVTRFMLLSKLKLSAALGTFAVLLLGVAGVPTPDHATAAPVPKEGAETGLLWVYDPPGGELIAHTPEEKKVKAVKLHGEKAHSDAFHGISAYGRHALFSGQGGKFPAADKWLELTRQGELTLHRKPLHNDGPTSDTRIVCGFENRFADTADRILHCLEVAVKKGPLEMRKASDGMPKYAFTWYDAEGKNPKVLEVLDTHQLLAALPGGELLTET